MSRLSSHFAGRTLVIVSYPHAWPESLMFGLFTPSCPLPTAEKTWVESRMLWFAERFGINRIRDARVILPTDEFFPDPYTADYPSVRLCLDRICGYMNVDPRVIALNILPDEAMPNAAGWYQMRARANICIAESQLGDPTRLMATLAHEVAHEILLRGGHLTGEEPDHEQVTDLLPMFLGIGIFGANATIRDSSGWAGNASWWSISHQGYLSSFVLGYALALFAFVREERWPYWRTYLRPDARGTFEKGLRFLQKTEDSLFTPESVGSPRPSPSTASVLDRLTHISPTFRVAGLWDIIANKLHDPRLLEPVVSCLSHRDIDVRTEAAWAMSVFGESARVAVPQLVALLNDEIGGASAPASYTLGKLRTEPKLVVPELAHLLGDLNNTPWEIIDALAAYRNEAQAAVPKLLESLEIAAGRSSDLGTPIARALWAICPDPKRAVREHIGERDPDLLRLALRELTNTEDGSPGQEPNTNRGTIPLPRPHR